MSTPFEPLSEREVAESLWLLNHKRAIRRAVMIFLVSLDAVLLLWVISGVVREIRSLSDRRALEGALVAAPIIRATEAPVPLAIGAIQSIVHGTAMDLIAEVKNPNDEFAARVTYTFVADGAALGQWEDVVPPQSAFHFVALGVPRVSGSIHFESLVVSWQRTDAHRQGRYALWKAAVGDVRVSTAERVPTSRGSAVRFVLKNDTPFHLRRIPVVILLRAGSSIVGANVASVDLLPSGSERTLEVAWAQSLPASTSLLIEPHVNLLEQENRYIPGRQE